MKILVCGGTGKIGSYVVDELLKRKNDVRMLVRKKNDKTNVFEQTEQVIGDLLKPDTVADALKGVDKLFLLNANVPEELTQALIPFNLAKDIGIKQIVYISVFNNEQFPEVPHFAVKTAMEVALKRSNVPHTILRPCYFFQNDLAARDFLLNQSRYLTPLGPSGISGIDVRDIAEAAAIVLSSDEHIGSSYNLISTDVLNGQGVAQIWSDVLGKKIRYAGEDLKSFEKQMSSTVPGWWAFDMRVMFGAYLERGWTGVAEDIDKTTQLLGHAPRTYKDFAQETADSWNSGS